MQARRAAGRAQLSPLCCIIFCGGAFRDAVLLLAMDARAGAAAAGCPACTRACGHTEKAGGRVARQGTEGRNAQRRRTQTARRYASAALPSLLRALTGGGLPAAAAALSVPPRYRWRCRCASRAVLPSALRERCRLPLYTASPPWRRHVPRGAPLGLAVLLALQGLGRTLRARLGGACLPPAAAALTFNNLYRSPAACLTSLSLYAFACMHFLARCFSRRSPSSAAPLSLHRSPVSLLP